MHGLFDKLRMRRYQVGPDPLEAAQARIDELTEALQGLVDLSDSSRSTGIAEVNLLFFYARTVHAARHSFPTRRSSDLSPTDAGHAIGAISIAAFGEVDV